MKPVKTPELFAKFNGHCGFCGQPLDDKWQRYTLPSKDNIPICSRDVSQVSNKDAEWYRKRIQKRVSDTAKESTFQVAILSGTLKVTDSPILFYYEIKALEDRDPERSVATDAQ